MSEKGAPRRRYDGQLGAQDGLDGSILGAILAHLGHLEANVNQNGEKAKNHKPGLTYEREARDFRRN